MRTREYVERGETEGKSLLDAIRDGSTEGMQCFDEEIEKLIRSKLIDVATGLSYATNAGNLRLLLADFLEDAERSSARVGGGSRPGGPAVPAGRAIAMDPNLETS